MDEEELAARSRGDLKYTKFVRYLEKAADLLGEGHYMYRTLKAKQYYFDAVDIAVRFEWRTFSLADSALIWKKQREEKIQTAFELEKNAAFILLEKGYSSEDSSIYYYEKAIELAPNWIFPYANLSGLLIGKGKFAEAESYAAKVKELAPQSSVTYALAAMIHLYKFENKQAEEQLLKAVEISPKNVAYLKMLAGAFHNQQKYRDAEKTWLRVLEISPKDNQTYNGLSELYYSNTFEYDKAEAINNLRLEQRPTDGDAYSDLIFTYKYSGQLQKIPALVEKMEHLNNSIEHWEGVQSLAYAYMFVKNYDAALILANNSIKNAPNSAYAHKLKGSVLIRKKEYDTAFPFIETALLKGMDALSMVDEIDFYELSKAKSFKAFAERLMEKMPENGFGYRMMSIYHQNQGDHEKSKTFYEKAVELSPDYENYRVNYVTRQYADCYLKVKQGDYEKALYFLHAALVADNRNYDSVQKDSQLDPLRKLAGFKELMQQYFPEKTKH